MPNLEFSIRCWFCAHDLIGAISTGHCPNCGEPVSHSLRSCALNASDMTVEKDLRCVYCSYNLRFQANDRVRSIIAEDGKCTVTGQDADEFRTLLRL